MGPFHLHKKTNDLRPCTEHNVRRKVGKASLLYFLLSIYDKKTMLIFWFCILLCLAPIRLPHSPIPRIPRKMLVVQYVQVPMHPRSRPTYRRAWSIPEPLGTFKMSDWLTPAFMASGNINLPPSWMATIHVMWKVIRYILISPRYHLINKSCRFSLR